MNRDSFTPLRIATAFIPWRCKLRTFIPATHRSSRLSRKDESRGASFSYSPSSGRFSVSIEGTL